MIATQTQELQELQQDWQKETAAQEPVSREDKIRSLLYLVQHIAGRVVAKLPAHVAKEDLISAGVVGLIDAVDRFDAGKGCSLKTYASLRIHGAMVDELRRRPAVAGDEVSLAIIDTLDPTAYVGLAPEAVDRTIAFIAARRNG